MSNALKGEAAIEAGGQSYTLILNIDALCEAEDALGMDMDEILAKFGTGLSVRLIRALVWAGLQAKHPCSRESASAIMDVAGVAASRHAITRALLNAMPEAAPKKNPPKRDRAGNG